jgi:hypothetical protein
MSRCIHCDYSADGAPSSFFEGLSEAGGFPNRVLRWDEEAAGFVCSYCSEEIFEALSEFGDEEELEEEPDG